ncbi:hypothetical protein Q9L58_007864 [Maublancomyces gigas]|uniref:gamma-glutamylcyclotransferase n=1 Tax=Discina gigas TaxID=1032678 RepID=A0ABR3GBC5_9PEZI
MTSLFTGSPKAYIIPEPTNLEGIGKMSPRKTNNQDGLQRTYYFAYGSNLWVHQMITRCPSTILIGTAILPFYRWVISHRGYANVVPSVPDECYGFIYTITEEDEAKLDVYEGVPRSYQKKILKVKVLDDGRLLETLVYIDSKTAEGVTHTEYVVRINNGLNDAKEIPEEWVKKYIRPFIPAGPVKMVVDPFFI